MKLISHVRNNMPFATAKFCQSCIWTFSVKSWQPCSSLTLFVIFSSDMTIFELKPDLFECLNLHFLILHLTNYGFTIFIPTGIQCKQLQTLKHVAMSIARGRPILWNPQKRINSIVHISKIILN